MFMFNLYMCMFCVCFLCVYIISFYFMSSGHPRVYCVCWNALQHQTFKLQYSSIGRKWHKDNACSQGMATTIHELVVMGPAQQRRLQHHGQ